MSTNPWDKKALEYGDSEIGAHSDENLVKLENEFIENCLRMIEPRPQQILDIGCGNGQRTKIWAKYGNETIGIDSSEEMIKLAKQIECDDNVMFANIDVMDLDANEEYDCIISARCLINLPTEKDQFKTISRVYKALKPGGYFICVEGNERGTNGLNEVRKKFGIDELTKLETNLDLSDKVTTYIFDKFDCVDVTSLSLYYLITRVITQLKNEDVKNVAVELQTMIDRRGDRWCVGDVGRHFCFAGRKE